MAEDKGADKTEKPTPHSLREARKRGEVPKSRDIGLTLGFVFSMVLMWMAFGFVTEKLSLVMTLAMESPGKPFLPTLVGIGKEATMALLLITAALILPIAVFGLLVEFLQTGPVMTIEKMMPKMSNLNPVEGVKRMFTMDNFIELVKSILQTSFLLFVAAWVILNNLDDVVDLPFSEPLIILEALTYLTVRVFGWTCLAFILMTFVDAAYQHHSFTKKMMMSTSDIKREMKDMEGDPLIKGTRRQLAMEWSQEGATQAARDASVLVVNPTHVAVALMYNPEEQKVPTISARGEEEMALAMREAAEKAGTPILRNEQLARTLLAAQTEDDVVPRALFDVVAEVILWAQSVRRKLEEAEEHSTATDVSADMPADTPNDRQAPGEDLTYYPPTDLQGIPT